ncbi:MAG: glucose-6-phosphate isomerase [Flavobacterium sp.]|nr:glucose-6-phosphate isomerase [Flavobacterium sp.]
MSKVTFSYGENEAEIRSAYLKLDDEKIIERIWKKDYTVWSDNPAEISNRLGWLDSPAEMNNSIKEVTAFVDEIRNSGFENVLLMGMGGSSLAPEVFSNIFGTAEGYLNLYVLDSTHPDNIQEYIDKLNPSKTLYIVSTKSGGTIETISFMKFYYTHVAGVIGKEYAGRHFTAITDPGSGLEDYAKKLGFRKIFLNNPDIGGRFSALSMFGLVPAALIGVDIEKILNDVYLMIKESKEEIKLNTSAKIGAYIGTLAESGIDKLTFIISESLLSFGVWVEQLIAESTGKTGKGILPIEREKIAPPDKYNKDRIFVYLRTKNETLYQNEIGELEKEGFPIIRIELENIYELGAELFRWEFATAVTGYILNVQPFDQPDVESAKILAREMIKAYQMEGKLPELKFTLSEDGIEVVSDIYAPDLRNCLNQFLVEYLDAQKGYVSIQAYVKYEEDLLLALQVLRNKIQEKHFTATTIGLGPRFLHSTGQLHKGDSGNGIFIQLFAGGNSDLAIPDEPLSADSTFTFGTLVHAQSLGDRQALLNNNRKVIRITLTGIVVDQIIALSNLF